MTCSPVARRLLALVGILLWGVPGLADEPTTREDLKEPVYRVTKATPSGVQDVPVAQAPGQGERDAAHPLDSALEVAYTGLNHIRANVRDYTCTLVKREQIGGELLDHEYIFTKIRHPQVENGQITVPFSVYMYFLKPDSMKGREVIYVAGANGNKLIAHEGGWKGRVTPTVHLFPDSALAMRNNRYPITEVGIATLTQRLIEKGERDRNEGPCTVQFFKGAKINGRVCTCLQVTHAHRRPPFDFHMARIFIDDEHTVPVRYEAYDWPQPGSATPALIEEYTYMNLKFNTGLTDADFSPENPQYNF